MTNLDDTQPNKPIQMTDGSNQGYPPKGYYVAPDDDGGPGCLVWGMVGIFCLILAVAVVGLASYSGWTEGLRVARGNATATRSADIAVQCSHIQSDAAANRVGLVQRRLESLLVLTPAPDCLIEAIPTATQLYLNNLPTATLPPTATSTPTPTLQPSPTSEAAEVVPTSSSNTSGFDPAPLLEEARQQVTSGDNLGAVDTLEAIIAIDPSFQKATVDSLLYQALTSEATKLYRTNGNLAEAILLTNRAEAYGDVGELNFERAIAAAYLEAQAARNINYPVAIRLLSQIVYNYSSPNYRGASGQLYEQLVKYGDSLALLGDNCTAQTQYDNAIRLQSPPDLIAKRDAAAQACIQGILITPFDPNVPTTTPDPNQPAPPTSQPFAPIGQPGT
jgi:tetratricopeptide (TPR) repeat protein